ncbi:MAG: Phosphoribosylaminoimidazole carboxylase, catalytic subunit [uncultured bacterium]|nr:MAG: Phosphoribosylaminoimidazole carboxylase, catalytic subunit [uncultured bacterium]HCU71154.1 5-(carboxyamino)imidazole ribonucleotide mutase [Candidatus Moranbacteria bacterium]
MALNKAKPLICILMGSGSDKPTMLKAAKVLDKLGIGYEVRITSAHRTPERTQGLIIEMLGKGIKIIIAGAGMAAHLAGTVAAQTVLPVIGVPLTSDSSPLNGQDALLATVQMPPGIPVNTMAIDGAANAGWAAAQMLAISDESLRMRISQEREEMAKGVFDADERLQHELASGQKEQ